MRTLLLSLLLILSALSFPVPCQAAAPKATKAAKIAKAAANPAIPSELEAFLGAPPPGFEQRFLRPAKQLKAAFDLLRTKKTPLAIAKLLPLAASGEFSEHASFELANLYRERKEFAKSSLQAEKFLRAYPGSPYLDRMQSLLDQNECDEGLADSAKAKTEKNKQAAAHLLELCLWRASWKAWGDLEPQATALYEILRSLKDPLLEPFVAEIIQARPPQSQLRQRVARELPNGKLDELASVARFRTKTPTASGVKPVAPDLDLFDSAMKAVMRDDWSEANSLFKRFPAEFPQSEHWDRAQYWIARTEEHLGHEEEARKRFEQIVADNPFTYYGLQSAIHLKRDLNAVVVSQVQSVPAKLEGSLLMRQALSFWRLRALMQMGLLEYAREEAKTLYQTRPGGVIFGQEDPRGALMLAQFFHEAGYHMAAWSHAYAAFSLDPTLVNASSLELIFPTAFANDFAAASEKSGVNSLLLLSVAKQESAFVPNAISRSDALGLMQVLHGTAQEVVPNISRQELFTTGSNTIVGALYLAKLLLRFEGNIAFALAAYNAGPTRMNQWQKEIANSPLQRQGFDLDVFIDSIPVAETRKYVGNIMRNYAWYKLLAKDFKPGSTLQEILFQWQKAEKKAVPQE